MKVTSQIHLMVCWNIHMCTGVYLHVGVISFSLITCKSHPKKHERVPMITESDNENSEMSSLPPLCFHGLLMAPPLLSSAGDSQVWSNLSSLLLHLLPHPFPCLLLYLHLTQEATRRGETLDVEGASPPDFQAKKSSTARLCYSEDESFLSSQVLKELSHCQTWHMIIHHLLADGR